MPHLSVKEPSRQNIWKMFDEISPTYDKVNKAMTLGLDVSWRKKLASFIPKKANLRLLDCATGTADQLIAILNCRPNIKKAVGIDLAADMLKIGEEKLKVKSYAKKVTLKEASALELPFKNSSFDCVTISFGIRNVVDVAGCLKEIHRVLAKNGKLLILEGSLPSNKVIKALHLLYLRHLLPRIGRWISKHKSAYVYLNKTIETFPSGNAFCALLKESGFARAKAHPVHGGIVTIYKAEKSG